MKIFFDYQAFTQQYGGISRYYCELITGINTSKEHQAHLSLLWSNNIHLKEYGLPTLSYPFLNKPELLNKSNRLYNRINVKINKYDIYHATYFDDFLDSYIGSKPFVVTFYDMIYERLSRRFTELSSDKRIIPQKRKMAHRASHLIAISESTKRDMVELLGIPPEKITVIYLGSPFLPALSGSEFLIPKDYSPYLLYVGKRYEYKNFSFFLHSIAKVLIRYQIKLICAGGGRFTNNEMSKIQALSLNGLVQHKEINDIILQNLYKGAIAFVFPSLYEGFGIPVLEAFACKCPCVLSNTSSLPEVAEKAALYMDPTDPESMAIAIERIITDNETRKTLIELGTQQLAHFSWRHTVNKTLDLYQKLI